MKKFLPNGREEAGLRQGEREDYARQRIIQDIVSRQLRPSHVINETELATKYNVSRTPLRVALALLENEGLLERAGRGMRVRATTEDEIMEILAVRFVIESLTACTLATTKGALLDDAADALEDILADADLCIRRANEAHKHDDRERERSQVARFVDLDTAFHTRIPELAGYASVGDLLRTLRRKCLVLFYDETILTCEEMRKIQKEHQHILNAIRERKPDTEKVAKVRKQVYKHFIEIAKRYSKENKKRWSSAVVDFLTNIGRMYGLEQPR